MKYSFLPYIIKVTIIILGFTRYAIAQQSSPTFQSLKKATEYWINILLNNTAIQKNEYAKHDIRRLRRETLKKHNNARTIDEYVAIFTLNWESTILKDGKNFQENYESLYTLKDTIQKLINGEKIKEILSGTTLQKNSEYEQEKKNEKEKKQDTIKKTNEAKVSKEKNNNTNISNIFVYVVLSLAVILPLLLWFWLGTNTKKKFNQQTNKERKEKQK